MPTTNSLTTTNPIVRAVDELLNEDIEKFKSQKEEVTKEEVRLRNLIHESIQTLLNKYKEI